jgi:hypothetical protein
MARVRRLTGCILVCGKGAKSYGKARKTTKRKSGKRKSLRLGFYGKPRKAKF